MPDPGPAPRVRPVAAALAVLALTMSPGAQAATLEADQYASSEGFYQLRWEAEEPVRLVEARSPGFVDAETLYTGSDSAHVVSGKPDGSFYYRLESAEGGQVLSEPVMVTVRHHSLGRALAFFAIGAIVFVSTLGLIAFSSSGSDERR